MGFFCSHIERLPKRGKNKLPLRGQRAKRLRYLRQFEVGRLYTFAEYYGANPSENWSIKLLMEDRINEKYHPC